MGCIFNFHSYVFTCFAVSLWGPSCRASDHHKAYAGCSFVGSVDYDITEVVSPYCCFPISLPVFFSESFSQPVTLNPRESGDMGGRRQSEKGREKHLLGLCLLQRCPLLLSRNSRQEDCSLLGVPDPPPLTWLRFPPPFFLLRPQDGLGVVEVGGGWPTSSWAV